MKYNFHKLLLTILFGVGVLSAMASVKKLEVSSPSGGIKVEFFLQNKGEAAYRVLYNAKPVIETSTLGFDFQGEPSIKEGLAVKSSAITEFNETWEMPWGEQLKVVNHYRQLSVTLAEKGGAKRTFNLVFRVFDDGVGFRYEFPKQAAMGNVVITDENTQFKLTGNPMVWWQPGDWDIYEHLYNTTRFTDIDAISKRNHPNLAQTYIPENAVNTPVTMKTDDGVYLSFHEAARYNYAGITLKVDKENLLMQSELVGNSKNIKVVTATPFTTPWRTIQITDRAGELIESKLLLNCCSTSMSRISWVMFRT